MSEAFQSRVSRFSEIWVGRLLFIKVFLVPECLCIVASRGSRSVSVFSLVLLVGRVNPSASVVCLLSRLL